NLVVRAVPSARQVPRDSRLSVGPHVPYRVVRQDWLSGRLVVPGGPPGGLHVVDPGMELDHRLSGGSVPHDSKKDLVASLDGLAVVADKRSLCDVRYRNIYRPHRLVWQVEL